MVVCVNQYFRKVFGGSVYWRQIEYLEFTDYVLGNSLVLGFEVGVGDRKMGKIRLDFKGFISQEIIVYILSVR